LFPGPESLKPGHRGHAHIKVDGFVKTIFPSFLDALAREGLLPEG